MEIILNDIAWKHKCSDKYTAIKNIKVAVEILAKLRRHDKSFKLFAKETISGSELAPEYYFGQLFSENEEILPQKYKTLIKTHLVNFNKINGDYLKLVNIVLRNVATHVRKRRLYLA